MSLEMCQELRHKWRSYDFKCLDCDKEEYAPGDLITMFNHQYQVIEVRDFGVTIDTTSIVEERVEGLKRHKEETGKDTVLSGDFIMERTLISFNDLVEGRYIDGQYIRLRGDLYKVCEGCSHPACGSISIGYDNVPVSFPEVLTKDRAFWPTRSDSVWGCRPATSIPYLIYSH